VASASARLPLGVDICAWQSAVEWGSGAQPSPKTRGKLPKILSVASWATILSQTLQEFNTYLRISSYYSDQDGKVANIIIRRQYLRGAYGDIGFTRQPDGQFALIKDELDEYHGYGARWLGRVQQLYKEKQTLAMARTKGYTLKSREVIETSQGEQVRLQFVARR
jgi:hypothetical protein